MNFIPTPSYFQVASQKDILSKLYASLNKVASYRLVSFLRRFRGGYYGYYYSGIYGNML